MAPPPDNGSGWSGPGGEPIDSGCHADENCPGGTVCARDGVCYAPGNVTEIHINWTVSGQPASETTCAKTPDLEVEFESAGYERLGYAPVPCRAGRFTVDKLPSYYDRVDVSARGQRPVTGFFRDGVATVDLPY